MTSRESNYVRNRITGQIKRSAPREVDQKREYRQIKKLAKKLGITVEDWIEMQRTGMLHPNLTNGPKR